MLSYTQEEYKITDQNEVTSEISESLEPVSLGDTSAEKATEGSDTDLEVEDPQKAFVGTTGTQLYLEACKLMKVVPVSYFIQNMAKSCIKLNHYDLGPKGVKAIAIELMSSETATHVELEDNCMLAEGAICIAEMLQENSTLQELETTLESALYFSEALMKNFQVKELDLSHNEFSEKGRQLLGQMLGSNSKLEILDLSWNYLRRKGAVALGKGLRDNGALKIPNLSWNGIGNEGANALADILKVNNMLVHLDISNNQINNEGAKKLCRGLEANKKLRILKMAGNTLTMEGAAALVLSIRKNSKSIMEEINISNYLKEHNLRLWDFFRKIDEEENMKIPVAAFQRAVMQHLNGSYRNWRTSAQARPESDRDCGPQSLQRTEACGRAMEERAVKLKPRGRSGNEILYKKHWKKAQSHPCAWGCLTLGNSDSPSNCM